MPADRRRGGGSIVNISSVAGLKGVAGLSGYCATKGGVRLFTKAVALECARAGDNIRVNSIHPGGVETPIWIKMANDGVMPDAGRQLHPPSHGRDPRRHGRATPLGFAGQPDDIADARALSLFGCGAVRHRRGAGHRRRRLRGVTATAWRSG